MGKPRMVRSDRYRKRPAVMRYWACKDQIVLAAKKQNFELAGQHFAWFQIQMPKSWSEKKKSAMEGKPHLQRPDLDNLEKSIYDTLLREDSGIWYTISLKTWARENRIIIKNLSETIAD